MDSLADFVPLGRWSVRLLHWCRSLHWAARQSYKDVLPRLSTEDTLLQWWMIPDNPLAGVPVQEPLPDPLIFYRCDDQGEQWGHFSASGRWEPQILGLLINALDRLAVYRALRTFRSVLRGLTGQIHADNTSAIACLVNDGGTHSDTLHSVVSKVFQLYLLWDIRLLAPHVPGKLNVAAHTLSRQKSVPATEWTPQQQVYGQLFLRWDRPMVDLFAGRIVVCKPLFPHYQTA